MGQDNGIIDFIKDSTKETRNALDTNIANGVNKFFNLLGATPVSRAISLYVEEAPYKLQQAREKMQEKYNTIPVENRIEPSPRISLNVANEFNYCLDEEVIKEMFTNILISDMDKSKKDKVLPGYIDTVKQLSKNDAEFLKKLKSDNLICNLPIIELQYASTKKSSFVTASTKIIAISDTAYLPIEPIILDNLLRLRIIDLPDNVYIYGDNRYEKIYEIIKLFPKYDTFPKGMDKLDFKKQKLVFTSYGKGFIDICLS